MERCIDLSIHGGEAVLGVERIVTLLNFPKSKFVIGISTISMSRNRKPGPFHFRGGGAPEQGKDILQNLTKRHPLARVLMDLAGPMAFLSCPKTHGIRAGDVGMGPWLPDRVCDQLR